MARKRVAEAGLPPPPSRTRTRILLFLLAVLPFLNGLPNDFTYDDLRVVRDDARLESPARVVEILSSEYLSDSTGLYRPVTLLSYAVQRWVQGPSASGLRLVNILLHAAVTLLLLEWLLALGLDGRVSAAAAGLFAVLPIHVEAVTSIVGRAELLAAAFSLGAALAFLRASRERESRWRWGAASAAAFALALLSKESAAVLPALLLLAEAFRRDPESPSPLAAWKRAAALAGGGAAILGAFLGLRLLLLGSVIRATTGLPSEAINPLASLPPLVRALNGANLLWLYAAKSLVPVNLSADYSAWAIRPLTGLADARLWLGAATWTACGAIAFRLRRRWPEASFGFLFFPAAFLVTANLAFPVGTVFAERLTYLPSAGVALLASAILASVVRRVPRLATLTFREASLAAVLVVAYLPVTVLRNRDWRDDRTLYASIVAAQPESARGHYLLGVDSYRRGDLVGAEAPLRRAVEIHPRYPHAWNVLAEVLWRQRKWSEALAAQRVTVELLPDSIDALFHLALWNAQVGRTDEARRLLLQGRERFPKEEAFVMALRELDAGP